MMTVERVATTAFERTAQLQQHDSGSAKPQLATLPEIADASERASIKRTSLPPLDLRALARKDSTSTTSSSTSHSPADDSSSSSSDLDDDDAVGPYVEDNDDFLVKPMSLLPVCPVDDIAVEDEKRRRRTVRMKKNDTKHRVHCPDAESLPSPTSQPSPRHRRFTTTQVVSGSDVARPPLSANLLRRDSMAIRQQYMKQLGLTMSRRDLERNSGKRRERHVGVKVRLNDVSASKGESKSIFQIISSWYASDDKSTQKSSTSTTTSTTSNDGSTTTASGSTQRRKRIQFCEDAELFYIPLHKDYSKRQRDGMWHTRAEFIAMVERNLDDVYEEMEREYEQQVQAEAAENDAMAQEEARQRAYEAQQKAAAAAAAAAVLMSPSPPQRASLASPGTSPPTLSLCPQATQIKVTPRARSPHDIRFKYLKHLGINNK